jgi:hypothetical protein
LSGLVEKCLFFQGGGFRIVFDKIAAMKKSICTVLVGMLVACGTIMGCGGGGATFQASGSKTLGQELQDLDASYQKGIITKDQYESTKEDLIKKYTR